MSDKRVANELWMQVDVRQLDVVVVLHPATPESGYTASVQQPERYAGAISEGETIPEALRNLAEAIELLDE